MKKINFLQIILQEIRSMLIISLSAVTKRISRRKPREKYNGFSFTHYVNCHEDSHSLFADLAYVKANRAKFHTLCMGLEYCPMTGKPHIQGYIFFEEPRTLHHVYRMLPHAHIEPSREGPLTNYEYCKKDGTILKVGNIDEAEEFYQYNIMTTGGQGVPCFTQLVTPEVSTM